MIVIGLTGGIGMGKSTLARQFELLGAQICNADVIVHSLLGVGGGAVGAVGKAFTGSVRDGAVDRAALRKLIFNDEKQRKKLEAILHPLVVQEEDRFVQREKCLGARYAILDIPLLFETGAQARCDFTVLASAPRFIQRQRVLARPGMNEELFEKITAAQMSEREKEQLADFIVPTSLGKAYSFSCLKHIMKGLP